MYKVSYQNNRDNFAVFFHDSNEYLFCVIAESNSKVIKGHFEDILRKAYSSIPSHIAIKDMPLEMAKSLEKILLEDESELGIVMYTGLLLFNKKLYICSAGGCRVHLLKGKKLIKMTKDHNLINDPPDEKFLETIKGDGMAKGVAIRSVSRALGKYRSSLPPENIVWDTSNKFILLICSSDYYIFKEADEYIEPLLSDISSLNNSYSGGVVAKIEAEKV